MGGGYLRRTVTADVCVWVRVCVRAQAAVAPGDRVFISPLARRLAREAGLAWQGLTGSGPLGRILAADVEKAKLNPPAPAGAAGGDFPAWVRTRLPSLPPCGCRRPQGTISFLVSVSPSCTRRMGRFEEGRY